MSVSALTVIHDDKLRTECTNLLSAAGFSVTALPADGRLALEAVRLQQPQVVLVESATADTAGAQLLRALRRLTDAYVVVLQTDGDNPTPRQQVLASAADDVLRPPLDPELLHERLTLMQQRPDLSPPLASEVRDFGALVVDVAAREVFLHGSPVDLTRTEFELLCRLSEHPRRVITRDSLVGDVWGLDWFGNGHSLDVHMANVRQKLGESGRRPRFIETVRGVGFRFNPDPDAQPGPAGVAAAAIAGRQR